MFVLNVVDGCIPSDLATGSTRGDRGGAAAALCRDDARQGSAPPDRAAALLLAQQRNHGDRHVYALRTRFIPAALLDCFDCRAWPPATVTDVSAKAARLQVDLKDRVRRTWG